MSMCWLDNIMLAVVAVARVMIVVDIEITAIAPKPF